MEIVFIILILLFSVVIHEVSHGYAALSLGDHTAEYEGRLTLNPLKHLDPVGSIFVPLLGYFAGGVIIGWAKPVPYNLYNLRNQKWGELLVAIAGPASNICIAIIFSLIFRFSGGILGVGSLELIMYIVYLNIILAIFNMIPIPPLDGSKVLFSLLPYRFGAIRMMFERFGIFLVLLFVFVFWQLIAPLAQNLFYLMVGVPFS